MRKVAFVQKENPQKTVRVMVHDNGDRVYLFPVSSLNDGEGTQGDYWFVTVADADEAAWEEYEVAPSD